VWQHSSAPAQVNSWGLGEPNGTFRENCVAMSYGSFNYRYAAGQPTASQQVKRLQVSSQPTAGEQVNQLQISRSFNCSQQVNQLHFSRSNDCRSVGQSTAGQQVNRLLLSRSINSRPAVQPTVGQQVNQIHFLVIKFSYAFNYRSAGHLLCVG
jgi:hypothetical protein